MQLLTRLNFVLLTVLGAAGLVVALFVYREADAQYRNDLKEASDRQMLTAEAARNYTNEHVRGPLLQDTREFHPAAIPTFAANDIMKRLQKMYPGHVYREVALDPTNRNDIATGWDAQAIHHFKSTEEDTVSGFETTAQGESVFRSARPIRMKSSTCLVCHGSAKAAPATVLAKYGPDHGFGWKLGDVVGAQVVTIPVAPALKRRNQFILHYLGSTAALMALCFVMLNWALRNAVVRPIQKAENNWRRLASEDPLTGAANRRSFLTVLDLMQSQMVQDTPLSLLFLDIDHFKAVNDVHGHGAGDEVLRELVRRVSALIRRGDMLARLGGEEFAVALPKTAESDALRLADKLRHSIAAAPFSAMSTAGEPVQLRITASFGVAQLDAAHSIDETLTQADRALYAAKDGGRNRAIAASSLTERKPNP